MKKTCLAPLFVLLYLFGNSQSPEVLLRVSDSIYFSNPDSSFRLCKSAEKLAFASGDLPVLAKALVGKARYLLLKTDYESAGKDLNMAYDIFLATKNYSGQADVLKLKSILYERLGRDLEGMKLLDQSIELYRKADDQRGMIKALFNYSLQAVELGDFKKARWALDQLEALESWMSNTDPYFLFQNSGKFEYESGNFEGSIAWYEKAIRVAVEEKMHDSYATATMLMGQSYYKLKNYPRALEWLNISKSFSTEHHLDHERSEALDVLLEVYKAQKDYNNAFLIMEEQSILHRELFNISRINRINELEKKVELSKKETELTKTNLELEHEKLANEKAQAQNTRLILGAIILVLALVFSLVLYFRTRNLKNKISLQAKNLETKNQIIEEAYHNITDSIQYAKRIQDAILPPRKIVESYLSDSFILYKPKDIVAGDFYWMESIAIAADGSVRNFPVSPELKNHGNKNFVLFAACDCTGHGVPGAMVSVLAYNALNRAVKEFHQYDPGKILDKVNDLVEETFANSENDVSDGMDISLCALDSENKTLLWAGANNPLWIVRDGKLIEYQADKQPIGKFSWRKPFQTHTIPVLKGDLIYVFSDGFADQFGEESGKKYKHSRFKNLLISIRDKRMEEQRQFLNLELEDWKGALEQIDDVCVIGVKIA